MAEYLRRAEDRKNAILNDAPDAKFYFESQKYSDIPNYQNRRVENLVQMNGLGARVVREYSDLIDAAAKRYSIDPDIVKAIVYTEVSRGWYGYIPEKAIGMTGTWLPGNINQEWQRLIPGKYVRDPTDNIELTTKLISQIAKRLDDPSIENIYSLYNGLSHDRTYVNKEIKATPYFAKMAMEAKAWEKDNWSAPEFPNADDVRRETLGRERSDASVDRFGRWGASPAGIIAQPASDSPASLDQRFGNWGSAYVGGGGVSNLPPMLPPNFVGPNIPFVSTPSGSLAAPGGTSFPDPTPMDPRTPRPFSTGGRVVPRSLPPGPLYPTGALVPASNVRVRDRQGSLDDRTGNPGLPAEDADRFRSPVASGVAAPPSIAASNPESPLASSADGSGAASPPGGVLKWIGGGVLGSAEASQPNLLAQGGAAADFVGENGGSISNTNDAASPRVPDNRRYLGRRIANQTSAFDTGVPAVPFISSNAGLAPDQPNAFDDRFGNWGSASGDVKIALPQQASRPLGILTGEPMPDGAVWPRMFVLPDKSDAPDGDDWFRFFAGLAR